MSTTVGGKATELFEPYASSKDDPWDVRKACHLYRRAAFGATIAEMDKAVAEGAEPTLQRLIHVDESPSELDRFLSTVRDELMDFGDEVSGPQAFWLYRCVCTDRPFAEKVALFWHSHFATANYKVRNPDLMYRQYETLRRHGRGKFEALLLEMAKDPAMLIWLDGAQNHKGSPNENFARELLELFTMGPGHYTETDIREAARALTGWEIRDGRGAFNAGRFDGGQKTFLGQTGAFGLEDIIHIVATHPATARFMARKLLAFFVTETPSEPAVAGLAAVFAERGGDVLATLDVLFRSRLFYSAEAYRSLIKSPLELVIGALRILDAPTHRQMALPFLANMGQELFNPPNVKGWDGGARWLNTVTTLERANFMNEVMLRTGVKVEGRDHLLLQELKNRGLRKPDEVVGFFATYLLQGDITDEQRTILAEYYAGEVGKVDAGSTQEGWDFKIRRLANLAMTLPAYQLN